uniref:acyl carrier protein phosphodiesterase n=1 Tax=Portibacter marinus TaxID=2898660 RepID=UPI001F34AB25|nr:acyl carrier protein phosphodiesterase [Portibacter marinus]
MADFITNRQVSEYSPEIQKGIQLHRMIDSFTDNHEMVRKGTKRLRNYHGKYAPVVIDILYDNILARNWDQYHERALEDFTRDAYLTLYQRMTDLPDKLKQRVPLMVADDFLTKYRDENGLKRALRSLDRRAKFASNFEAAAQQLRNERALFESEFHSFFPEVVEMSRTFCKSELR